MVFVFETTLVNPVLFYTCYYINKDPTYPLPFMP